mgnify:FL=1
MTSGVADLTWPSWFPLQGIGRNRDVADRPGLYLIRSVETGRILYVGQTGRSLRARLGSLRGVYGELMPYNDPHTVGPALWAHRIDTGETFEASLARSSRDGSASAASAPRSPSPAPTRALTASRSGSPAVMTAGTTAPATRSCSCRGTSWRSATPGTSDRGAGCASQKYPQRMNWVLRSRFGGTSGP